MDVSHAALLESLSPYAGRDLQSAIAEGRLTVPDVRVALAAAGGALLGVTRAVLENQVGDAADVEHAEGMLRMFGLPADEAAEVASRPMPQRVADQPT